MVALARAGARDAELVAFRQGVERDIALGAPAGAAAAVRVNAAERDLGVTARGSPPVRTPGPRGSRSADAARAPSRRAPSCARPAGAVRRRRPRRARRRSRRASTPRRPWSSTTATSPPAPPPSPPRSAWQSPRSRARGARLLPRLRDGPHQPPGPALARPPSPPPSDRCASRRPARRARARTRASPASPTRSAGCGCTSSATRTGSWAGPLAGRLSRGERRAGRVRRLRRRVGPRPGGRLEADVDPPRRGDTVVHRPAGAGALAAAAPSTWRRSFGDAGGEPRGRQGRLRRPDGDGAARRAGWRSSSAAGTTRATRCAAASPAASSTAGVRLPPRPSPRAPLVAAARPYRVPGARGRGALPLAGAERRRRAARRPRRAGGAGRRGRARRGDGGLHRLAADLPRAVGGGPLPLRPRAARGGLPLQPAGGRRSMGGPRGPGSRPTNSAAERGCRGGPVGGSG